MIHGTVPISDMSNFYCRYLLNLMPFQPHMTIVEHKKRNNEENIAFFHTRTLSLKSVFEIAYAHQGYIYLITYIVKNSIVITI